MASSRWSRATRRRCPRRREGWWGGGGGGKWGGGIATGGGGVGRASETACFCVSVSFGAVVLFLVFFTRVLAWCGGTWAGAPAQQGMAPAAQAAGALRGQEAQGGPCRRGDLHHRCCRPSSCDPPRHHPPSRRLPSCRPSFCRPPSCRPPRHRPPCRRRQPSCHPQSNPRWWGTSTTPGAMPCRFCPFLFNSPWAGTHESVPPGSRPRSRQKKTGSRRRVDSPPIGYTNACTRCVASGSAAWGTTPPAFKTGEGALPDHAGILCFFFFGGSGRGPRRPAAPVS